jgi:uncharacterized membrane protein
MIESISNPRTIKQLVREILLFVSTVVALPSIAGDVFASEVTMTYVFVCSDLTEYVVRVNAKEAWVFRPGGSLNLPAISTAQAGKYSNGNFELAITGEQAEFGETGSRLQVCHNDRRRAIWEKAKLDGADFRAVGNEPPWVLEIRDQSRVVLVTGYGAKRIEMRLPPPVEYRDARTTRWIADEFQLEIAGHRCNDSMSGETFESTVILVWHGQTLRGCGQALH